MTPCSSSAAIFTDPGSRKPIHDPPRQGGRMTATKSIEPVSAARVEGTAPRSREDYPGPPLSALPGLLRKLWRDRLSLLADAAQEFGDVVRFTMGPKTIFFFNHPDHAKHVLADNAGNYHKGMGLAEARRVLGDGLLTSEGETWRRQRRAVAPAFRRERIAGFAGVVTDEASTLLGRLESRVDGPPVDLASEMTRLTIGVLGRTLLDADLTPLRMLGPAFEVVQDQAMFEMVTLGALPLWLPLPRNRRFRAARRQLQDTALALLNGRERVGRNDGDDVISLLLRAHRDEPDGKSGHRKLNDELVTILLAGHETTASTLSWTSYLLSRNPRVARILRAEAAEVLRDGIPDHEALARLPYTTMVIQEAMRLYPPVWGLPRKAVGPDEVGGYRVPAGADVMICPYTLHRHSGFWDDPGEFRPERFDSAAVGHAHRYAYIPFGAGPRVCVGSHLGMMEAVLATAMVARRFRFELADGFDPVPEAMLSLRVRRGLPMTVRRA
jgi:enediyne biosynthesis protein E7